MKTPDVIQFFDELKHLMVKHGITEITSADYGAIEYEEDSDSLICEGITVRWDGNDKELRDYLDKMKADYK